MIDRQIIQANKDAFKKDAELLKEITANADQDKTDTRLYWRKGDVNHPEQLGDFIRSDIMTGPWSNQTEATEMPAMVHANEKTRAMYARYFDAKRDGKLESDPVVSAWVKNGEEKAKAIDAQHSKECQAQRPLGYDPRDYWIHKQMGR